MGVSNWMLGGETIYLVSGEIDSPRLTLPCDLRAQVSLGVRCVVIIRPWTWKLSPVLCIVELLANLLCIRLVMA